MCVQNAASVQVVWGAPSDSVSVSPLSRECSHGSGELFVKPEERVKLVF